MPHLPILGSLRPSNSSRRSRRCCSLVRRMATDFTTESVLRSSKDSSTSLAVKLVPFCCLLLGSIAGEPAGADCVLYVPYGILAGLTLLEWCLWRCVGMSARVRRYEAWPGDALGKPLRGFKSISKQQNTVTFTQTSRLRMLTVRMMQQ